MLGLQCGMGDQGAIAIGMKLLESGFMVTLHLAWNKVWDAWLLG